MKQFKISHRNYVAALLFSSYASAVPVEDTQSAAAAVSPNIAVLGDSWGSGVAYTPLNEYDGNKDYCLRWNEAYGAQLDHDKSWSKTGDHVVQFVACSGSRLFDIVGSPNAQMKKLSEPKDAIIMTTGGNNVGFFNVANNCIFHWPPTEDYGPAFPDAKGKCAQAIEDASNYIDNERAGGFRDDLRKTYQDMLNNDMLAKNKNAKVYHTGYAEFFSTAGKGAEDWCEATQASFSVGSSVKTEGRAILTKSLREAINALTDKVNTAIKDVAGEKDLKSRFRFVDINPVFAKHRFCELGSNIKAQYFDSNIWLWNVVAPGLGAANLDVGPVPKDVQNPGDFQFDQSDVNAQVFNNQTPGIASGGSDGNNIINGWRLRPFHPKSPAYTGIKNAVVAQMKADKIPGVA